MARRKHRGPPGWARARDVLVQVVGDVWGRQAVESLGRVRFLGRGVYYAAFGAGCQIIDHDEDFVGLVVRLPHWDAGAELTQKALREVRLLEHLDELDLPIRLPSVVGTCEVDTGLALVQEWVEGIPLGDVPPTSPMGPPWDWIAEAAAVCHAVDVAPFRRIVEGCATRREYALGKLAILDRLDFPEAREARAWAESVLPPDQPACLLHGDLLPQNLILSLEEGPLGVIDWSMAIIGDPAYDLAITTRGSRQPFKHRSGFARLLDAYHERSGTRIESAHVRLYELCLKAGFYLADVDEYGAGSPAADNAHRAFCNLLNRARGPAAERGA